MNAQSIETLVRIRRYCLWGTFFVILLAAVSLAFRNDTLRDMALVLSVSGTAGVTYLTAKVINAEKEK